jgi:hypothetical protein
MTEASWGPVTLSLVQAYRRGGKLWIQTKFGFQFIQRERLAIPFTLRRKNTILYNGRALAAGRSRLIRLTLQGLRAQKIFGYEEHVGGALG